jgi:uncharacterized protein YjiS (DUF1127 family)
MAALRKGTIVHLQHWHTFVLDSANSAATRTTTLMLSRRKEGFQMAYATDTRSAGSSLVQKFSEFRAAMTDRMAKYKMYRATLDELARLDDRDLSDLGISRSMIKGIATEAAYGK